jgi:hypothetical protein
MATQATASPEADESAEPTSLAEHIRARRQRAAEALLTTNPTRDQVDEIYEVVDGLAVVAYGQHEAARARAKAERRQPRPGSLPPNLPDELWTRRPYLTHIRQAAFSRYASPDAYLGDVLVRQAAAMSHSIRLPAIVGSVSALNLYLAQIGTTGSGKSSSFTEAARLFAKNDRLKEIPAGSGEGLVEAYFEMVDEQTDDGKAKKVKKQTRHNLIARIDEGQALTQRNNRNGGSTFLSTIRSMWTGGLAGETNATIERKRSLPAESYSLGLTFGFQPAVIGPLLADVETGTPQRFLCLSTTCPSIPSDAPEWPGELPRPNIIEDLETHQGEDGYTLFFTVEQEIRDEITSEHIARQQGLVATDPMDSHRNLHKLKIAGLLAYMDSRLHINTEDWELAETILSTSDRVRQWAQDQVTKFEAKNEAFIARRMGKRAAIAADMTEEHLIHTTAEKLLAIVRARPGQLTRGKARAEVTPRLRDYCEAALEMAIHAGWITERTEDGQGTDKARLYPGEAR